MSFDWTAYVALARHLADTASASKSPEAHRRSAISRAYFGAHHVAALCASRRDPGVLVQTGEDHSRVIRHFKHAARTDTNKVGRDLERLRDNRNHADYAPQIGGLDQMCADSVLLAESIIERVARICP